MIQVNKYRCSNNLLTNIGISLDMHSFLINIKDMHIGAVTICHLEIPNGCVDRDGVPRYPSEHTVLHC